MPFFPIHTEANDLPVTAVLEINREAGTEDIGPTAAARRGGLAVVDGKIPLNFGVGI
jgi:hypothetical protein